MNQEGNHLFEDMESKLREIWFKYHHFILPQDTDLSPVQLFLLKFVHKRQSCTTSDIAKGFGITLGAVTGLVDRLYKSELVSRTRSEQDRRLVLIQLTSKGIEELQRFEQQRQYKFSLMMNNFKTTDVQNLTLLMGKLGQVLDKLNNKH